MAKGDIYFYASSGSVFDRLIARWTGSRFVHVAIAYDDTSKIEMLGQGCVETAIVASTIGGTWTYPEEGRDEIAFQKALNWLAYQVGEAYGWNDIAEALDKSHRFLWLQTGHVDCSHLAAEFLQRSGYNVDGLGQDLARVTPGQLATFLHIR